MSSDDENEYQDDFEPIVTYADSLQDQPDDSSDVESDANPTDDDNDTFDNTDRDPLDEEICASNDMNDYRDDFEPLVTFADDRQDKPVDSSDVDFDTNPANDDNDTIDNADCDPLDEEFRVIDTFVNSLTVVMPPRRRTTTLAKADMPNECLDTSTYCTQNAHGLWQLAKDDDGNRLSNQPRDTTRFKHLIALMKVKCLDEYFLQDTWLEDNEFDIDVGGYHVFRHNGPNGNHLHHGVVIVLSLRYYAGWKAAGAAPPITTDTASEFVGRFIGITIKLESRNKRGRTIRGEKK
jgi:hypothetical protein